MTKPILHKPQKDSPSTFLAESINQYTTTLTVVDSSIFQDQPLVGNVTRLTLGFDTATTETVTVVSYGTGNRITVERGAPSYSWGVGTKIARVFTSNDLLETHQYLDYLDDEIENTIKPIINLQSNLSGKKSIFRGLYLGDTFTQDQKNAISYGTLDNLFLGDYWTMGGINYRIADFNYWNYGLGGMHLVIVPDTCLLTRQMDLNNNSYYSLLYYHADIRAFLNNIVLPTMIASNFDNCIAQYYENLQSNTNKFNEVEARLELMSESMAYGQGILRTDSAPTYSINQLALFKVRPEFICCYQDYWLRDRSGTNYCMVSESGLASYQSNFDQTVGIRPCFAIAGVPLYTPPTV